MSADPQNSDVLAALQQGSPEALDRLVPLLYDELRVIAHRHLSRVRQGNEGDGTLVTTALVNEAYLKLVDQDRASWTDRVHFLAIAAVAMRHILIDRARARATQKRGDGVPAIAYDEIEQELEDSASSAHLLEIDDALNRLSQVEPRLSRVVELRFYGGLTDAEIAEALQMTTRTVQRDWVKARSLLRLALAE